MISFYPSKPVGQGKGHRLAAGFCAAICLFSGRLAAEPDWWKGEPRDAKESAVQTNRGLFLYFESESSEDCIKMNDETWPKFEPGKLKDQLIFVRLNPAQHGKLFQAFDVYQTPEIVITDPTGREEKGRIRGLIDPKMLGDQLSTIELGGDKGKIVVNPDGTIGDLKDDAKARKEAKDASKKQAEENRKSNTQHFYYESFDAVTELKALDKNRYNVYLNPIQGIYIDLTGGRYKSPALCISAFNKLHLQWESKPASSLWIDVSEGLDKEGGLVEGRLKVILSMRATKLPELPTDIAAVSIVAKDRPPLKVPDCLADKRTKTITLANSQSEWQDRWVVTEPFNFRTEKAYLSLWVDFLKQGFYVDDIRVDVLPPTDVASASGGSADAPNPQDMFGELEKKEVPGEFDMLDSDKNRRIDRKEIESPFGKRWVDSQNKLLRKKWSFESKDKDRNGYIDLDEWKK